MSNRMAVALVALFSTSAMALPPGPVDALPVDALPVGNCINMGNHLEAPAEGRWGRMIAPDDFAIIAKAGFATIRLPVRWSAHAGPNPPYAIDPAFMARVVEVVGMARAAGLNVILNDHNYAELFTDPDGNRDRLAGLWQQIAARFSAAPRDSLWFEIENEPHDKLDNANLMATLAPALATIRASNPNRPVIIGGEHWSSLKSLATLQLPDDPYVVPTFHYYEPFHFTHQGASWVTPIPPTGRVYGSDADRDLLVADVGALRAYVARTGKTPFLGEFGSIESIPIDQRILYQGNVHAAFAAAGVGTCAWAYTNTFKLYDSNTRSWLQGMRRAMGLAEQTLGRK